MNQLVTICFETEERAFEFRAKLIELQREYLLEMEDVVIVSKNADGKVQLHQAANLTAVGAVNGAFWGSLIGLLFMSPLLGAAVGAGAGALSGSTTDVGINDDFMKQLGETLVDGTAAVFVLIRRSVPDKLLTELQGFGGTVLKTSLSVENEEQLRKALAG
ncbi:MAG: DUF1269 domain-containing protein [Myxococcota bacterium]